MRVGVVMADPPPLVLVVQERVVGREALFLPRARCELMIALSAAISRDAEVTVVAFRSHHLLSQATGAEAAAAEEHFTAKPIWRLPIACSAETRLAAREARVSQVVISVSVLNPVTAVQAV